jgi:hypothetical protein
MSQTRDRVGVAGFFTQCPSRKPGGEMLLATPSRGVTIVCVRRGLCPVAAGVSANGIARGVDSV